MKTLKILGIFFLVVLLYLLLWPVAIHPKKYSVSNIKPYPLKNPQIVSVQQHVLKLPGKGPEDMVVDKKGNIYAGLENGNIVKINLKHKTVNALVKVPGRPLGLAFLNANNLLIAVVNKGVFELNLASAHLRKISKNFFGFEEAIAVKANKIYVTDGGKFNILQPKQQFYSALERDDDGRLLQLLKNGHTKTLLRDLHFANGLVSLPDTQRVLLSDMYNFRLVSFDINTQKKQVFIAHLPGYPDNLSVSPHKTIWVAIYAPEVKGIRKLARYPILRALVSKLPRSLLPGIEPRSFALEYNLKGKLLKAYEFKLLNITTAVEYGGYLYLGNLTSNKLLRIKL